MKNASSLTEKFENLLEKESNKFAKKQTVSKISGVYSKLSKHGLLTKSEYTFPLKDTIGKTYFDKSQFTCQ
jgi:hypothetical protein